MVAIPSQFQRQTWVAGLMLALVAVSLYAPLIGWGLPYATTPDRVKTFAADEILPLEALAEMHHTFVRSKPDRNYGYPWWHYFVVAAVQAPYLVYLNFSGGLEASATEYPYGLKDPVRALQWLTLIGRLLSVLMGAGIVVAAYFFSSLLWGHLTGVIAAALTMVNYPMVYYARTGNLDVPSFFWISIGLVIFAQIFQKGLNVRRAAWLGVFAGLAMATKDQAAVIFLPLGLALLAKRFSWSPATGYRFRPLLFGLGASIITYLVGTGMLVDPQRHLTHVHHLFFNQDRVTLMPFYQPHHPRTWAGLVDLTAEYGHGLLLTMSLPVLIAAAGGVVLAVRRSLWYLIFVLPIAVQFLLLNLPTGVVVLRYFLPFALPITLFAAHAIVSLRRSPLRAVWVPALALVVGWNLLFAVDLSYAQFYDSRYAASEWLRTNAGPGERVEFFGVREKVPPLPAEIPSRRLAGRTEWARESGHGRYVLDYLAQDGPEYVLIIPDLTSRRGMEHSGDCPPEVYEALINGSAGYRLVAHFGAHSLLPERWQRPRLDSPSVSPPVRIFERTRIGQVAEKGLAEAMR